MTQEIEKDGTQVKWESIARLKYVVWALLSPVLIFGLGALSYDYFSTGEYVMGTVSAFFMFPVRFCIGRQSCRLSCPY